MVVNKNIPCTNENNTGNRGRNGVKTDYKWIVVHYVGACDWKTGFESTAENNCKYYATSNVGASANFYVDSKGVWQSVPWDSTRYAWHCGTGSNKSAKYLIYDGGEFCNNTNSLGVEICTCKINPNSRSAYDKDWYFDPKTYANAVEFVKQLMKEFNIDINHVVRHYDVNSIHKPCPSQLVGNDIKAYYGKSGEQNWAEFKQQLTAVSPASPTEKDIMQAFLIVSTDGKLNLRDEPNNSGDIVKVMGSGALCLGLKETSDGWVYVKYLAGGIEYRGWCYAKYLAIAKQLETRTVSSPDGTLNIRTGANTACPIIATMGNGFGFFVLKKLSNNWGIVWCGSALGYCDISDNYSFKK